MDLIPNLCSNSGHEDMQIRHASLSTLSMICEELDPSDLTDHLKNDVILALTNNISGPTTLPDVLKCTEYAIKALL